MQSSWVATGVVAAVGSVVLLAALLAVVLQKGPRRAALVAGLAPAALVPAVVAVALTALQLSGLFGGMAVTGGGAAAVLAGTQEAWQTVRVGFGLATLVGLVGGLGGLLRFGAAPPAAPACSARRGAVLALLPLLALLVTGLQARELRVGVGITHAVVTDTGADSARQAAVERYLEAHDLRTRGSAGIAELSQRIARGIALASLGGGLLVVILLGLSLAGTILAWPVRVGLVFVLASSGFWAVLTLASTALALGFGAPPTF